LTAKKSGKKDNNWGVPCHSKSCLKSLGEWGDHFVRVAGGEMGRWGSGEIGKWGEEKTNRNILRSAELTAEA